MENTVIMTSLSALSQDIRYYSESEAPFTVANWGKLTPLALAQKIADVCNANSDQLNNIPAGDFFRQLIEKVDSNDKPMIENANKIKAFYDFFNTHLSDIRLCRVEGATRIPIFISGYLPDESCIVIQTQAIET